MQAGIIINPVSGTRRLAVSRRVELARRALEETGSTGSVEVTRRASHATELTRRFISDGATTVVVWGGDGTVNEVASVLAFSGRALGIVPGGSGNGLARELRIPTDPRSALRSALVGRTRWLDAGELGGRLFLNVAGIGFDAQLAALFNSRQGRGLFGYVVSTAGHVFRHRAEQYEIRTGGISLTQRATMVAIANTRQYGNNAMIAPLARPDDGLLELVVVPALTPLGLLWQARRMFLGTVHELAGVTMRSVREVQISCEALRSFHVDGEVVSASGTVTGRVRPHAIEARVPDSVGTGVWN